MPRQLLPLLGIFLCTFLSGCSYFNADHRQAMCVALKQNLVFGGNTSDTRRANIEGTEIPLEQHNYDKNNCS